MNIAFCSNKLTLRGTEVALYDYAHYNETLLSNKSIIITRDINKLKHEFDIDEKAYQKFKNRFIVEYYETCDDIDKIVVKHSISHLYIIKGGNIDGLLSKKCKNLIHCVFHSTQPHGDIYSVIGNYVNHLNHTDFPVVPHMVDIPTHSENLRVQLGIPDNVIVFGRYGGKETFDISFVHDAIRNIVQSRKDVYFLFMNTYVFFNHPQIIYLEGQTDMNFKRSFINTCDALIHARNGGETFGLTCGEFAICEKPVITFKNSREKEHLLILKNKAICYSNYEEVFSILNSFEKNKYDMKNNGYMNYRPENVMSIFKSVYLQ